MIEERTIKVEQKQTFANEVKKWIEDHFDEILLAGMFVGGTAIGLIFGFDLGNRHCEKKVMKGIEKFCNGELEIPGLEIGHF